MRHIVIACVVLASVASGCITDDEEIEVGEDGALADAEDYLSDGKSDAAYDTLSAQLKTKYGVRPRRYNGLFDGSNEAERRFVAALPRVTAMMNHRAQLQGLHVTFTQAELATNLDRK